VVTSELSWLCYNRKSTIATARYSCQTAKPLDKPFDSSFLFLLPTSCWPHLAAGELARWLLAACWSLASMENIPPVMMYEVLKVLQA